MLVKRRKCIIAGLHSNNAAAASGTESSTVGVFTRTICCLCCSNGRQLPAIQRYSATGSWRYMHYFFWWHRSGDQSEHRSISLRKVSASGILPKGQNWSNSKFKSGWSLVCRCHWRNRACRIGSLPLVHRKLMPTWQPSWVETGRLPPA